MEIDTKDIAQKIEENTYYAQAQEFYDTIYQTPISERSYFIVLIALGIIVLWVSIGSFMSIFPLQPTIPFAMATQDIYEDLPTIEKLDKGYASKNDAVLRYLIRNYINRYESYNFYKPQEIERNFKNIGFHSARNVLIQFRDFLQTSNPSSPYNVYGRDTSRSVVITSMRIDMSAAPMRAVIEFNEVLEGARKSVSPEWIAEMEFAYTPFEVAQDLPEITLLNFFSVALEVYSNPDKYTRDSVFKIKPMTFTVSSYTTKPKMMRQ